MTKTTSRRTRPQRRNRPRRRVTPLWRRPAVGVATIGLGVLAIGAGAWWAWNDAAVSRLAEKAKWHFITTSQSAGLTVQEILVTGREQTTPGEMLSAIRLVRGAPLLAFDPEVVKQRVESLPWVRSASVQRMMPGTVIVNVIERRPLAIWQHEGRFALIDFEGEVILRKNLERYSDLMVVVGTEAPRYAADLVQVLATQPELREQVKAAVRVGKRRWDIHLDSGISIQLPEKDQTRAWSRLAEYQRNHSILARDIQMLDLRLPDRVTIRRNGAPDLKANGRET